MKMLFLVFCLVAFVVIIVFLKDDNNGKQQTDRRAQMDEHLDPNNPYDVCYAMAVLAVRIYFVSDEKSVSFNTSSYDLKNKTYISISAPELKEKEIHQNPTLDDYLKLNVPESFARFLITIPGLKCSTNSWNQEVKGFEVKLDSTLSEKNIKNQINRATERTHFGEIEQLDVYPPTQQDQSLFIHWNLDA
jgi:hypothetical protein